MREGHNHTGTWWFDPIDLGLFIQYSWLWSGKTGLPDHNVEHCEQTCYCSCITLLCRHVCSPRLGSTSSCLCSKQSPPQSTVQSAEWFHTSFTKVLLLFCPASIPPYSIANAIKVKFRECNSIVIGWVQLTILAEQDNKQVCSISSQQHSTFLVGGWQKSLKIFRIEISIQKSARKGFIQTSTILHASQNSWLHCLHDNHSHNSQVHEICN